MIQTLFFHTGFTIVKKKYISHIYTTLRIKPHKFKVQYKMGLDDDCHVTVKMKHPKERFLVQDNEELRSPAAGLATAKHFNSVIAFDESHNMGNAIEMEGRRERRRPAEKPLIRDIFLRAHAGNRTLHCKEYQGFIMAHLIPYRRKGFMRLQKQLNTSCARSGVCGK